MVEIKPLVPISYDKVSEPSIFNGIPKDILQQAKLSLASNPKRKNLKPGSPWYNMELINEINCIIAQRNIQRPVSEIVSNVENQIRDAYGKAKVNIDGKRITKEFLQKHKI